MTQLYIGNLPDNCSDDFLQNRFGRHGRIKEILLKGKFAFVEYEDSRSADAAIKYEKDMMDDPGSICLDVELANRQVRPVKGPATLHILNIPGDLNWEKLKIMMASVGRVEKAELTDDGEDNQWKRGIVTYELKEDAQTAIEKFHDTNFEGARLQVICPEQGQNSPMKQNKPRSRKGSAVQHETVVGMRKCSEESNFPVRLVVPSTMIGAIIGKEGKTIRRITDSTGARVDIHRKDNAHSLKKEITIFGNAETCNQAISMILKIIQDERATLSKPAVSSYKSAVLELLAHNDLLQKIFGHRHAGLIDLMKRTGTKITITQTDELGKKPSQDRHVIIEGPPENCCAAQREISEMYNAAFERDMLCIMNMTKNAVQQRDSLYVDHQMNRQMGRVHNGGSMQHHVQKMKYGNENQMPPPPSQRVMHGAAPPLQPPAATPQLSPEKANALLRLLSDITQQQQQHRDYYQQQQHMNEQLVLAGQLIASDYLAKSPQPTGNYQKFSTPKHPVYPGGMMDHGAYASPQGYSPFPYAKHERSPMKQSSYTSEEKFNMMSMLEGLDEILSSHDNHGGKGHHAMFDGSQDSGIQTSPHSLYNHSTYWNSTDDSHAGGYSNYGTPGNSLNSSGNSARSSSTGQTPEELSFYNGSYSMNGGQHSSDQEEDFLSNSLLRTTWSTQDDSFPAAAKSTIANGTTFENSNLRRELQNDMPEKQTGGQPAYPPAPQTPATPTAGIGPALTGSFDGVPNNLVRWTNFIPLVIGQKIESVKTSLEQMTRTRISLSPHPNHEKVAIIKAIGTSEGTQMLQNNVQLACKQLVHGGA